jgi:hypothetical protein
MKLMLSFVDGNPMFGADGGNWGSSAAGLITSATSLGPVVDGTYTLSMVARASDGAATPMVLDLLADGVVLVSDDDGKKINNATFNDNSLCTFRSASASLKWVQTFDPQADPPYTDVFGE